MQHDSVLQEIKEFINSHRIDYSLWKTCTRELDFALTQTGNISQEYAILCLELLKISASYYASLSILSIKKNLSYSYWISVDVLSLTFFRPTWHNHVEITCSFFPKTRETSALLHHILDAVFLKKLNLNENSYHFVHSSIKKCREFADDILDSSGQCWSPNEEKIYALITKTFFQIFPFASYDKNYKLFFVTSFYELNLKYLNWIFQEIWKNENLTCRRRAMEVSVVSWFECKILAEDYSIFNIKVKKHLQWINDYLPFDLIKLIFSYLQEDKPF